MVGIPFVSSALLVLSSDQGIKELAKLTLEDPSYNQMVGKLPKALHGASVEDSISQFDVQQFNSTVQQMMQSPQFLTEVELIWDDLLLDSSINAMLETLTDPAQIDKLGYILAQIENSSLKSF